MCGIFHVGKDRREIVLGQEGAQIGRKVGVEYLKRGEGFIQAFFLMFQFRYLIQQSQPQEYLMLYQSKLINVTLMQRALFSKYSSLQHNPLNYCTSAKRFDNHLRSPPYLCFNPLYSFTSKKPKQTKPTHPPSSHDPETQSKQFKMTYQIKKQTVNLQVASEAQLQRNLILNQIKRQREQMEEQLDQQQIQTKNKLHQNFVQKFVIYLTAGNLGIYGLLSLSTFSSSAYWLGMFSSSVLFSSFLAVSCTSIGINLAYLVVRQGLGLHTKIQQLKSIQITESPPKYYIEMSLIAMQLASLATLIGLPITLMQLQSYRDVGLYTVFLSILTINAHNSYQLKQFPQNSWHRSKHRISAHSYCFIVMFVLVAYTFLKYNVSQPKSKEEIRELQEFQRGFKKFRQIWKMQRVVLNRAQKITDIIQKDQGQTQHIQNKDGNTVNKQIIKQNKGIKARIWSNQ